MVVVPGSLQTFARVKVQVTVALSSIVAGNAVSYIVWYGIVDVPGMGM